MVIVRFSEQEKFNSMKKRKAIHDISGDVAGERQTRIVDGNRPSATSHPRGQIKMAILKKVKPLAGILP